MKQNGRLPKMLTCAAALTTAILFSSAQAVEVGKAVVRKIEGSAQYAEGGGAWSPLKTGQVLKPGAAVRTANDSHVDLFMDENGPVVRLTENTTLQIDKLNFEVRGVDTLIETQLDVKSGKIVGIVKKLSSDSKYEVKTPNGVAGIRGTEYVISATSEVSVLSGSAVVVYVKSDGSVITQVVNAGEMFSPATGQVLPIPSDELAKQLAEVNDLRGAPTTALVVGEMPIIFVSPTTGQNSSFRGQ